LVDCFKDLKSRTMGYGVWRKGYGLKYTHGPAANVWHVAYVCRMRLRMRMVQRQTQTQTQPQTTTS
jgi:hypothetical protein